MDIDDIWYYNEYGATCEGCSKITSLQCVETCIRSGFTECEVDGVQCNSAVGPSDEDFDSDTITTTEGTEKPKSEKKKQMSGGAIAAIVLIILLFICFTAAYLYYRKAHQLTPCPTKLECIECCSHCKQMRYSKPAVQVEEAKVNNTHTLGLPRPGKRGELVPNISASADASADGNA
uniref:Uncharacterized protein n=1 Tax=Elphidium margaritaceum TaxID=933848 RepID=A0A7S0TGL3_9EUKA